MKKQFATKLREIMEAVQRERGLIDELAQAAWEYGKPYMIEAAHKEKTFCTFEFRFCGCNGGYSHFQTEVFSRMKEIGKAEGISLHRDGERISASW